MVETPFMHPIVQILMHVTSPVTMNHLNKIKYQLQARHILKKFKPFQQKSAEQSRDTLLHNAKVLKEIEPQDTPKE